MGGDTEQRQIKKSRAGSAGKVEKEQLQELQRILDGKKASLRKIYQTKANSGVWELIENTMTLLAKFYEKYDDLGKGTARCGPGGGARWSMSQRRWS